MGINSIKEKIMVARMFEGDNKCTLDGVLREKDFLLRSQERGL